MADKGELCGDLVFEVPRQDENDIRFPFGNRFGSEDGDARSREKFSLFMGVAVDRKFDEVGANTAVIEESIALGWSAIGGDLFALSFKLKKLGEKRFFDDFSFSSEMEISVELI